MLRRCSCLYMQAMKIMYLSTIAYMCKMNLCFIINFFNQRWLDPNMQILYIYRLLQYIYIYITSTSTFGLLSDHMNLNYRNIFSEMYNTPAIQCLLIYIPAVPLNPWISSVSCSYLVFPEVNVLGSEKNALTSSLMHMHFLTFHTALSVGWISPRLPASGHIFCRDTITSQM